jgi:hypothetical protein
MRKARRELQPAGARSLEAMEAELARIGGLYLDELRVLWRARTQQSAHKALSRDLLARLLAYRIQGQALGKLSRETCKLLERLARGEAEPVRHLEVGTVMVREHQGRLHEVMVVPGGFSWREKTYTSLSTIARAITGTSWNGPRFFGLRGNSDADVSVEADAALKVQPRLSTRTSVRANGRLLQSLEGRP